MNVFHLRKNCKYLSNCHIGVFCSIIYHRIRMRISGKIVSGYPKPRKIIFAYFYSVAVDQYLSEMNTISWFQVVLYCFLYTLY